MDRRSEEAVIQYIKKDYPDHIVIAEESGADCTDSEYRWLIDPLDGTANYIQGISMYSVSIAVLKNDALLAGAIYHPDRDELFYASQGGGAFLNRQPMQVSSKTNFADALLGTGFPLRSRAYMKEYLETFDYLYYHSAGVRRMGSAALDLAYTACGRFDGFWEMQLHPWDMAAGILIIEEAGGLVTDFTGGKTHLKTGNIVAGNPSIYPIILEKTREKLAHVPGIYET
jgi:myo-inositol-1(or 4)-monophosphatase